MTRSQKNAWLWVLAIILLLILLSCGSKKTVTNTIHTHDTIMVHKIDTFIKHHSDTVKDIKYVSTADSVKEKEYHTYYINNVGDTTKEVHHYHTNEKIIILDSSYIYKVEIDSLRAMLEREKSKTQTQYESHDTVKVKKVFPWDVLGLVVFVSAMAILVMRMKKD